MNDLPTGTVTFLFTDIEGSSRLWREEPEAMTVALARHDSLLRKAIEDNKGHVVKMRGDGVHAVFASAVDGALAALAEQQALAAEDWPLASGQLKVRMSLHTGHAQFRDEDYFGQSVNQAARIQDAGHGGQILLSWATQSIVQDALPDGVSLHDMGEHRVRDFPRPERVYQLTGPGMDRQFPPLKTLPQRRSNLPHQPTPFVGREEELAELAKLLADPHKQLVTVMAPGGMGKTRLALAAAEQQLATERFPHGVFFVALAPLSDPDPIPTTMAEAFDLPLETGSERRRTPEQQVLDYLKQKQPLLVLDNFEHLLAGAALVNKLLQVAPGVQILVTSRERLQLRAEHLYSIGGLEFPAWESASPLGEEEDAAEYTAVRLFVQSARQVLPGFEITKADLKYLSHICRLVAGMPLALELAAGWVDMLSLADIVAELEASMDFLETEVQDVPDRQRSIRAVFDTSWARLNKVERDVFSQLSVFRGGFSRKAGQTVTGASLRTLSALVNKSLLQYDRSRDRYQLHELLRQYAAEKLVEAVAVESEVWQRHCVYYCQALAQREEALKGDGQLQVRSEIEADVENIRAAWHWAVENGEFVLLAGAMDPLGHFFEWQGRFHDGESLFARVSRVNANEWSRTVSAPLARALVWQSVFLGYIGDRERAGTLLEKAAAVLERQRTVSEGRSTLAFLSFSHGMLALGSNYEDARAAFESCLALYRDIDDTWALAKTHCHLGEALFELGRFVESRQQLELSLGSFRQLKDKRGVALCLERLSQWSRYQGLGKESLQFAHESYEISKQMGSEINVAMAMGNLAFAYAFPFGDFEKSYALWEQAVSLIEANGEPVRLSYAYHGLGIMAMHLGRFEKAQGVLRLAISFAESVSHFRYLARPMTILGMISGARKEMDDATLWAARAVDVSKRSGSTYPFGVSFLVLFGWRTIGQEQAEALVWQIFCDAIIHRDYYVADASYLAIARLLIEADTDEASAALRQRIGMAREFAVFLRERTYLGRSVIGKMLLFEPLEEAFAAWPEEETERGKKLGHQRSFWGMAAELRKRLPQLGWFTEPIDLDKALRLLGVSES